MSFEIRDESSDSMISETFGDNGSERVFRV